VLPRYNLSCETPAASYSTSSMGAANPSPNTDGDGHEFFQLQLYQQLEHTWTGAHAGICMGYVCAAAATYTQLISHLPWPCHVMVLLTPVQQRVVFTRCFLLSTAACSFKEAFCMFKRGSLHCQCSAEQSLLSCLGVVPSSSLILVAAPLCAQRSC
jgi:hypothetical protein